MNVLVLVQSYPSNENPYSMGYVHTRNIEYIQLGYKVDVLNFSADCFYEYDGVKVFNEKAIGDHENYDLIVSHAPNLKNHLRFLSGLKERKVCFFFHGHEVLRQQGDYPDPYLWNRKNRYKKNIISLYDSFKILSMRYWLPWFCKRNDVGAIFVSQWMQDRFERNLELDINCFSSAKIIPNSINRAFKDRDFDFSTVKEADFVTIRPLDESKYCMDLVYAMAEKNPTLKFHVYGKGDFFKYHKILKNMEWFDCFISQADIPKLLDKYRCALMPTRYDAQGVMACEMATYGMPLITTDIDICQEMLGGFDNVFFIKEENFRLIDVQEILKNLPTRIEKKSKFFSEITVNEEVEFFGRI